jgi:maltose alpha-D-glucosyltransferase/alpha-amylase
MRNKAIRSKKHCAFWVLVSLCLACGKHQPVKQPNQDAWYKHLLIYNLDVKTFKDSNGDGEGDFNGLTEKLDYLRSLGVNTIWLAPFQPSPLRDDGYDVTDYYGIDPKLGTQSDYRRFMTAAKAKHFKVIMDLVLNHTSNMHPWFREASRDTNTQKHSWYVWSVKRPKDWDKGMGFPLVEKETWRFLPAAHEYYFHRFYNFQPDLNYQNPAVEKEAEYILGYWLDQGMDGFRLDAVPFIIDDPRKSSENPRFDFNVLHELTAFVKRHKPGAVLLGEANVEPEENAKYFGEHTDGLNMMFNFYANEYLFYGLAKGNVDLFKDALKKTSLKPPTAQWTWFLRNHDEIDIGRLSKHQKNEVYAKMAPDTNMRLYDRGIRRRLAPMLNNDPAKLRLCYGLLYSLPGTPVIRQGEEIGMGDDLKLKERLSVRTPMQWDTTVNAGFSTSQKAFRPIINTGTYAYHFVNVLSENGDAHSLLNFVKGMINLRKQCPEINNGEWQLLDPGTNKVLVICYSDKGKSVLICHNFDESPQTVTINVPTGIKQGTDLLGHMTLKASDHNLTIALAGSGFRWFRLN